MEDWRRRVGLAIVAVAAILLAYSLLYRWALATYVGVEISLLQALQVVIEALTTAGFGGDTDLWRQSDALALLVIAMNLSGVLLVFLALPLFAVPMFRQALQDRPPETSDLTNHVIICGHSRRDEILSDELEADDVPYLYVESDSEEVRDLLDDGIEAIRGDAERAETFRNANATSAKAVVADIGDERNPTVILSANRVNPLVEIVSVVRDAEVGQYHRLAGADEVVEAPRVLGESLGTRAVTTFAEKFREALGVESDLEVTELLVQEDSEIAGQTLRETTVFDECGITVVGGWFGGKFVVSPAADTVIGENTILLVAGRYDDLSDLKARQLPAHRDDPERVVVCGYGVVGHAVVETIEDEGFDHTVVDADPGENADVVGDVTDPTTLREARVGDARAVVLALDSDTTTIFATLVLDQLVPDVEIIARIHDPDNVWKLYNAGADFVLSMSVITGEMLASELIDDREILTPQAEFEFLRTEAPELEGLSLGTADIRAETGATVVAVEREGELLTDLGPGFVVEEGDVLVVSGTDAATERFVEFAH